MQTRSSSKSVFKKAGLPQERADPVFATPLPKTPKRYTFSKIGGPGSDGELSADDLKDGELDLNGLEARKRAAEAPTGAPEVKDDKKTSAPFNIVITPNQAPPVKEKNPASTKGKSDTASPKAKDIDESPREKTESPFKIVPVPTEPAVVPTLATTTLEGGEPEVKKTRVEVYKYDMPYLEQRVQEFLTTALVPFQHFGGMLANSLGDRKMWSYWKYPENYNGKSDTPPLPLKKGTKTVSEFLQQNAHLGADFFTLVMPLALRRTEQKSVSPALVGAEPNAYRRQVADEDLLRRMIARNVPMLNVPVAAGAVSPMILFSSLPLALFDDLFHATSIGAMLRAASQINRIRASSRPFTLKELVLSPEVADVFALYVSYQYLMSSGGNAYAGRVTAGGGTTFMISAGIKTREKLYSDIATGQFWWKDVFARPNPVKEDLRKEIERQEGILKQEASLDNVRDALIRKLIESEAIDSDVLITILTSPYNNLQTIVNSRFQVDAPPLDYNAYNQSLFDLRFDFVRQTSVNPTLEQGEIRYLRDWGQYKASSEEVPPTNETFLQQKPSADRLKWNSAISFSKYQGLLETNDTFVIDWDAFDSFAQEFDQKMLNLQLSPVNNDGEAVITSDGQTLLQLTSSDFEKLQAYAMVNLNVNTIDLPKVKTMIESIEKLKRQFEIVMDTILVHRE